MGACQARGGAGPRAKHGASAQPTPTQQGGVGLSKPHASLGAGWAETLCAKIVVARIAHISQNVLIPCVENVVAVGGKSWGWAGLTPLGVTQRRGYFLENLALETKNCRFFARPQRHTLFSQCSNPAKQCPDKLKVGDLVNVLRA